MKKIISVLILTMTLMSLSLAVDDCCKVGESKAKPVTKSAILNPGQKIALPDGNFLVYKFSQKPALGTAVVVVKIVDAKGTQIAPYTIRGNAGMPSMQGAHDSGEVAFELNKRKDYLLPVNVVMQGAWEVKIKVKKGSEEIFKGVVSFHV